ncbi:hypothetical protein HIM_12406 [Hirsutella minnesotensis 3608]|uniref:Uncharacterized protein n=1 Tax=Hirsutella minnesotensis 3608 TaxID=1043627 RepID=A0A0F7ZI27_9HYPO|nr:hypothetical protein HIM_12406 [Hirsutella minnesotensis 3608]
MFGGGRCMPQKAEYHIPAIISRESLREDWFEDVNGVLQFNPPNGFQLECLRGQHRVRAAQSLSYGPDRWLVDFYDSVISEDTKTDLIENYDGEMPPDDGEFYYKVRLYMGVFDPAKADGVLEKRWRARWNSLPKKRTKDERNQDHLEHLLGHHMYVAALDQLQHLPVLYSGLWLGSIGRMISLGCDEELLSELRALRSWWYGVFEGNECDMGNLDRRTLETLQRTAPGVCEEQKRRLLSHVTTGEVLGAFRIEERERIFRNVCAATVDGLVPSLDTFFRNLSYREVLKNCMTRLVPLEGRSLRSSLADSFQGNGRGECLVQVDEDHMVSIEPANEHFDLAYRQLWLFAMRHHASMPPVLKPRKAGPRGDPADKRVLFEFARLAHVLGFRTTNIDALLTKDPDRDIARGMLESARRPERFEYPDMDRVVSEAAALIQTAVQRQSPANMEIDPPERERVHNSKAS